jgi:hypothetical protein
MLYRHGRACGGLDGAGCGPMPAGVCQACGNSSHDKVNNIVDNLINNVE